MHSATPGMLSRIGTAMSRMRRSVARRGTVCPACDGINSLRVEGTGQLYRRGHGDATLFCTRSFSGGGSRNCGFVVTSRPCRLPRGRIVLLSPAGTHHRYWGAALCRGRSHHSASPVDRYECVFTPRNDQRNEAEVYVAGDPFRERPSGETDWPAAVRGLAGGWPLVTVHVAAARWRHTRTLVTISPWEWEQQVWQTVFGERAGIRQPSVHVDGLILPLALSDDLGPQLECVAEMGLLLKQFGTRAHAICQRVPLAVVASTSPGNEAVPVAVADCVQRCLRDVLSGPVCWFSREKLLVRAFGWNTPEPREAIDLADAGGWLLRSRPRRRLSLRS